MIATLTLNPSIDQHIVVKGLVKDDANRARSIFRYPGGKGVNVSKVVKELRGRTRAFALAGGLAGRLLEKLVGELGIPFSAVTISGDTRINTILTDLKDLTQTRISAPGPVVSGRDLGVFLKKLLNVRPKPFVWALGGSLPVVASQAVYREIIFKLQRSGTPCILDADEEALKLGIQAKPFMIKPNEYEMARLVGHSLKGPKPTLAAARSLVKKGVRIVVVSLGAKGALFVTANQAFHVLTPAVAVKSKVGAGDSLIAGVAVGLSRKMGLVEAARLGVAASTSAVMREAPRLCLYSDIRPLLGRIQVRSL